MMKINYFCGKLILAGNKMFLKLKDFGWDRKKVSVKKEMIADLECFLKYFEF